MRRNLIWMVGAVGLCAIVGLVFATAIPTPTLHQPPRPLPIYGDVPMFTFTNQEGRVVTRVELAGHVWIADFIFTRCAGQCPLMSERMAALQQVFAAQRNLRFVSFSVDPEHDTPSALSSYARRYGARAEGWMFVTGTRAAIHHLVEDGFRLSIAEGISAREPITHSVRLVLVDQRGRIRGYYDAMDAEAIARLQQDVRQLLGGAPTA